MKKLKNLMRKYDHAWTALYLPVYLIWFFELEQRVNVNTEYTVIHCFIDDYIPFCEYFIIPYLLWFLIIPAMWIYLFLKEDRKEFYQYIIYLYSGMSLSLFICTIFPNGQDMRPVFSPTKNICTEIIAILYKTDTSTNVFPSIHVFNSIAFCVAVMKNQTLRNIPIIKFGSIILTISICLSTVCLKQHSILDGLGALGIALILYYFVYVLPEKETYALRDAHTRKSRKFSHLGDSFYF